jgi:frataxin-like iron-binding protein CyaY
MTIEENQDFHAESDTSAAEISKHLHDAINHRESLDLTFATGDFVAIDPHTAQYILNKEMVQQMIDSTDSPENFQLFLNQLFDGAGQ